MRAPATPAIVDISQPAPIEANATPVRRVHSEYNHMSTDAQKLNPDAPAHYRICAQGIFDARWLDMLSGVWALYDRSCSELRVTILVGSVADQAALIGVLNHLYNLGLPLISVEWLWDKSEKITQSAVEPPQPPARPIPSDRQC